MSVLATLTLYILVKDQNILVEKTS